MRYIFAGDRKLSVEILDFMIKRNHQPLGLIINSKNGSHLNELINISQLEKDNIFDQKVISEQKIINSFYELEIDYIICIHFPFIISRALLELPKIGVLNLHPSYLPYNKGWHCPSWCIIDNTPIGVTFHWIDDWIDSGNICFQEKLEIISYSGELLD